MEQSSHEAALRLTEDEARLVLLVRAVEETDHDGVLLALRARSAGSRRVFDGAAPASDDAGRIRARARLLRDDLLEATPALAAVLAPPPGRGGLVAVLLVAAAIGGALANLLGAARHVSILAFPLAGILAWNLAVYLATLGRLLLRVGARGRPPGGLVRAARWLAGVRLSRLAGRLGASARSAAATDAVTRYQRLWLEAAGPLSAARVRVVLHLAALATALGAIAGLYASGIAFEYRATWESTWLETPAVQRYVDTVLGPAARLLGRPVPDVAPLRGPGGEGDAAPWIHLWATTLVLVVLVPRAVLAVLDVLNVALLSRRLPVRLDAGYVRRALHSGRGAATQVEVVYYSCVADAALRERLNSQLQDQEGARAVIHEGPRLDYGDEADRVALPPASGSGLLVVVFPLAQTPEPEVHGEFLQRLHARLARTGWRLSIALDAATYRQRVGSDERVRERRATWDRLLRELELPTIDLA